MDLRLGLSLLLLLIFSSCTQSKNIRDGPNLRSRHAKRATISEFLIPPAPSGKIFNNHPLSTNIAPPPFIPPPPGTFRNGKYLDNSRTPTTGDSRNYFSRLMSWLNPWSSNDGGLKPPPQTLRNPSVYNQDEQRSVPKNGPFNPERSCNPCNDEPWIPIRQPENFKYINDGRYLPSSPSHEIRQPDFTYSPFQNNYPMLNFANHPIPNPHMYPGAMPPLYRATEFSSAGNIHLHNDNQPASNYQVGKASIHNDDNRGSASTNIQDHQETVNQEPEVQGSTNQEIGTQNHVNTAPEKNQENQNQGEIVQSLEKEIQGTQNLESVFGQKIQSNKNQNQDFRILTRDQQNSHLEILPSIGGQISSEQIHYERSPIIDLSLSTISPTPLILTELYSTNNYDSENYESSTKPSSLIDYLVAGYNDRIPIPESTSISNRPIIDATESSEIDYFNSARSHEDLGYNEKQPFLEALMESYYNFKREEKAMNENSKTSATNFSNGDISGGDNFSLGTHSSRTGKKNKQVQIIIPYTSQFTPSPFHSSIVNNKNGDKLEQQLPRKIPSFDIHYDPFDEGVIAQESNTVSVTSLPDVTSTSSSTSSDAKNNSIDVQRLQKNIDNWTIQEYSNGMIASTIVPNATHPYLSPSKIIPNEYFITKQHNTTSDDENYDSDEDDAKRVSSEFDFEDYKQMTTFEISRVTQEPKTTTTTTTAKTSIIPQNSVGNRLNHIIEAKENEIPLSRNNSKISENNDNNKEELLKIQTIFANTSINKKGEKVYVVTPLPIGEKELKKAYELELKKKPKKNNKDNEKIERAYQVLPQAVNNLAVASTGPENSPLWGIMEHEEFASSNSDNESQLPILYTGHSKVSHARR